MTIPEHAVQAAAEKIREVTGTYAEVAHAALTAAAPHLSAVRVKKLEDWQLDQILTGVKSQVNHNGWEEPYVRNRLRHELERILSALETSAAPEPIGYLFQHEDTGLEQVVEVQQVEWGFEKNNPRWQKIGPVYSVPVSAPSAGKAAVLEEAAIVSELQKARSDYMLSDFEIAKRIIRAIHPVADKPDEAGAQGEGWLPIESAPKDGTLIDMWTRLGVRITDVRWVVEDRKGLRHPELAMDGWKEHGDDPYTALTEGQFTHWYHSTPPSGEVA